MAARALTSESFSRLLLSLDPNQDRAGEKYEDLRRTLIRFFEWRSAPFPEEQADECLNRVAYRLGEGVEIRNVGSYCYEVARLVFLETTKRPESKGGSLESVKIEPAAAPDLAAEIADEELRISCLENCLRSLPRESADLILEYYQYPEHGQVERRRNLAKQFGLRREALANRAQRLRDKLQYCVSDCVGKKSAI